MNKQLYNFAQAKFQQNRHGGQIKNSALATKLHNEFHFGKYDLSQQWLIFTLTDILQLSKEVQLSHGVDIRNDPYPVKEDRLTIAATSRNEKENSCAVSKEFILINSLTDISINQACHKVSPLTSLGMYIKAEEITSIEHSAIVLVENLAVMANLNSINLAPIQSIKSFQNTQSKHSNIDLSKALWLYRGDVKAQQKTSTSYHFFRHFKGNTPLVCFSDLDPKGVEIALTSGADYWLTIENTNEIAIELSGNEQEWYKQGASIDFLLQQMNTQISLNDDACLGKHDKSNSNWQAIFRTLLKYKKSLKQEHILQHKLSLKLVKIG